MSRYRRTRQPHQASRGEFAGQQFEAEQGDTLAGERRLDGVALVGKAQLARTRRPWQAGRREPGRPGGIERVFACPLECDQRGPRVGGIGVPQRRAGQRREAIREQRLRHHAGIGAAPVADRQVGLLAAEIDQPVRCMQFQVDVRVLAAKVGDPRRQPMGHEGVRRRNRDRPRRLRRAEPAQHGLEGVEAVAQHRVERGAGLGQDHLAHLPVEQHQAGVLLEKTDLVAHRGRRYGEFGRGLLEAAVTSRGLEGTQG